MKEWRLLITRASPASVIWRQSRLSDVREVSPDNFFKPPSVTKVNDRFKLSRFIRPNINNERKRLSLTFQNKSKPQMSFQKMPNLRDSVARCFQLQYQITPKFSSIEVLNRSSVCQNFVERIDVSFFHMHIRNKNEHKLNQRTTCQVGKPFISNLTGVQVQALQIGQICSSKNMVNKLNKTSLLHPLDPHSSQPAY